MPNGAIFFCEKEAISRRAGYDFGRQKSVVRQHCSREAAHAGNRLDAGAAPTGRNVPVRANGRPPGKRCVFPRASASLAAHPLARFKPPLPTSWRRWRGWAILKVGPE